MGMPQRLAHVGAYRCYLVLKEDSVWNNMVRKIRAILIARLQTTQIITHV